MGVSTYCMDKIHFAPLGRRFAWFIGVHPSQVVPEADFVHAQQTSESDLRLAFTWAPALREKTRYLRKGGGGGRAFCSGVSTNPIH